MDDREALRRSYARGRVVDRVTWSVVGLAMIALAAVAVTWGGEPLPDALRIDWRERGNDAPERTLSTWIKVCDKPPGFSVMPSTGVWHVVENGWGTLSYHWYSDGEATIVYVGGAHEPIAVREGEAVHDAPGAIWLEVP